MTKVFVLLAVQVGGFPDKRKKKYIHLIHFKDFQIKTKENNVNQAIINRNNY